MTKTSQSIILGPMITEKNSTNLQRTNTVCFKVSPEAGKIAIAQAVNKLFNVTVQRVNTASRKGKVKRRRQMGVVPGYKKAFVTLAPGQKIGLLEGLS